MAIVPKNLASGQLPSSAAAIYTAPTNITTVVTAATFTNIEASNGRTATIYLVRSGGSFLTSNILMDAQAISATKCYVSSELPAQILGPGDALYGVADAASKVNYSINGYETTT